ALLSVSAGIAWGFVAAVIKELSSHVDQGIYAVLSNWAPYVLILSGAVAMFLVTNAFQAGPLAASQPGLTVVDPLVASLLGTTLFGERLHFGPLHLIGEVLAVAVLVGSVLLLSRSPLIREQVTEGQVTEGQGTDRPPTTGGPSKGASPPLPLRSDRREARQEPTRMGNDS
ncbi:MAG TPA: DMT family transporter, partial [Acidimicrobiales bacterium]|nr:DMT family transporter [Acidimicrobiales bacterium]